MLRAVGFLETDFSHFPFCGFQTLLHDAIWLNIMLHWPLSGKDNLPKTDGINLCMIQVVWAESVLEPEEKGHGEIP